VSARRSDLEGLYNKVETAKPANNLQHMHLPPDLREGRRSIDCQATLLSSAKLTSKRIFP
jgi:hypothetical protein